MSRVEKEDFFVLDARTETDFSKWLSLYNAWEKSEPFAHPAYCKLFCDDKTNAKCAVLISSQGTVMYPFLLRDIKKEAYAEFVLNEVKDIITPYGYGGQYIISCFDQEKLIELFNAQLKLWAQSEHVVCEVIKFHLFKEDILPYSGDISSPLSNIVVDLLTKRDELWLNFDHKVRKNVKKAQRSNLKFVADNNGKYLDQFLDIYYQTMDRKSAKENYYFNTAFFKTIIEEMPDNFHFFHVFSDDKIISTELCMVSKQNIYSYLGGTLSEYFELRPNDLLKYEIILWGMENKKERFVLGGGYQDDDGIFKYKRAFAPEGILPFYLGTKITNENLYNQLIQAKKDFNTTKGQVWEPIQGFIPGYRT